MNIIIFNLDAGREQGRARWKKQAWTRESPCPSLFFFAYSVLSRNCSFGQAAFKKIYARRILLKKEFVQKYSEKILFRNNSIQDKDYIEEDRNYIEDKESSLQRSKSGGGANPFSSFLSSRSRSLAICASIRPFADISYKISIVCSWVLPGW